MSAIVQGMSNADYHAHPAISKSCLDLVARSPFHYHAGYLAPDRPEREATPSMKIGSLAHCVILEPQEVEKRYVIKPADLDLRTKAGKDWLAAVRPDVEVITVDQLNAARSMFSSLLRIADLADAFACGIAEQSIFYDDHDLGLPLKIRPDWIHETADGGVILVDVKTCADASPREFARSAVKWRYHVQAALYSDVYACATERKVHGFAFAVVENAYPYAPACYMLDDAALAKGRALYERDLRILQTCIARDSWPAFGPCMQLLSLPAWALTE